MLRDSSQQAAYIFRVLFWSLYLVCWLFFAIAALPLRCLGTHLRRRASTSKFAEAGKRQRPRDSMTRVTKAEACHIRQICIPECVFIWPAD
jgi:hypothetical protein